MIINYFALKKRVEACGIRKEQSKRIIRDLRKLDHELKKAFGKWYKFGIEPSQTIAGVTFEMLTKKLHMNEINAFLTLDWLKREPNEARAALGRPLDMIIAAEQSSILGDEQEEDTSDLNTEE